MSTTLTIRDEELTGKTVQEFSLQFPTERITVRELIRSRVYQEVADHNALPMPTAYRGLVQPTASEQALNGERLEARWQIDWRQQFAKAIEAFEKHLILILVDNRQLESLDEEIDLTTSSQVSFLKLKLLVGG